MQAIRIILTIIFIELFTLSPSFSQSLKNYDSQWKVIDTLIQKKNLPRSALIKVKAIYNQAKKEGQDAQIIKCLLYIISLQDQLNENNEEISINNLEKEIKGSQ